MALRHTQTNDSVALILDGAFFEMLDHQSDLPIEVKTDGNKFVIVAQTNNSGEKQLAHIG